MFVMLGMSRAVVLKEATPGTTHEEKAMVVRDAGLPSSLVEDSYVQQLIQQHKARKDAIMREDSREVRCRLVFSFHFLFPSFTGFLLTCLP
jgi:hypothetical protein